MNFTNQQIKVFSKWFSKQLEGHSDQQVNDVTKDLTNGLALIDLATILTQKQSPREWNHSPKRNIDMIDNCELAINMFSKDSLNLTGITGRDINQNNDKSILSFIWSLILHYSIGKSTNFQASKDNRYDNSSKSMKYNTDALISWAIDRTSNYPNVNNRFEPYDLSMCALLDSYYPEKVNFYSLNPTDSDNNTKLMEDVMNDLGIPIYLYPDDISDSIDEKSLLTQLSSAKLVLDSQNNDDQKSDTSSSTADDELDEANKAKEIAESEVERLKRELTKVESNLKIEKENLERANQEIQSLKKEKEELETRNNSIQAEFEKINQTITDTIILSQKFSQKVWNDEIEIDRLKEETIRLNSENKELKKPISDQEEFTNKLSQIQQNYSNNIENLTKQITILNNELSISETTRIQLSQDVENNEKEIENLKKALKESEENGKVEIDGVKASKIISEMKETNSKAFDEIIQLKNCLYDTERMVLNEQMLRQQYEQELNGIKISYSKLEDESKRYKSAADDMINDLLNEVKSLKEISKKSEEIIQQQNDKLEQSEKNNELLSSLLRKSQLEAENNKNKFEEADKTARSLSKTLKDMSKEFKYQYQVNGTELLNALIDAENEREAKQAAQSNIDHLSSQLSKSMAEATITKNSKEVALQHIDELTKELNRALNDLQINKNKANEAERISRELTNQLNDLHHQYNEMLNEKEATISRLSEEAENERELKQDAVYEVEQLSNKLFELEAISNHQKNQYEFEIDKLKDELADLKDDLDRFKEANEQYALKVENLHKNLIEAQFEAQINRAKEAEAIRVAEGLSKSLKEFENQKYSKDEIDRLTNELSKANNEITLHKEAKENAESNIAFLNRQFKEIFIEFQKKEAVRTETERMARDLSKSLDEVLKESKAQREQDASALNEARRQVMNEQNAKEAAKLEVDRLTKELKETETIVSREKDVNRQLQHKNIILNNILSQKQKEISDKQ